MHIACNICEGIYKDHKRSEVKESGPADPPVICQCQAIIFIELSREEKCGKEVVEFPVDIIISRLQHQFGYRSLVS